MSVQQRKSAEPFPSFPPPPPAPGAVKATSNVEDNIPPPPPVPDAPKVMKGEKSEIPPPPPPAPKPEKPIDHVVKMAKKGATFYYEGKKVSSEMAIELIKKNNALNIQTTGINSVNPKVRISKEPIVLDTENKTSSTAQRTTEDIVAQIVQLAEEGALFLLFDGGPHFKDGQKITSKRAIEIVKKVNGLTVHVQDAGYIYKVVEIRMKGC
jgi:hypothetical protein